MIYWIYGIVRKGRCKLKMVNENNENTFAGPKRALSRYK